MGRAARERGYEYLAICDHTPAVGAVRGLTADDVRRQAEEIAAANEVLAPFRVLRGIECDILPDGRLDLPDDVLAELDWVQASVHGGQRMPRREMTKRVEEALRNPYVRCLSHPTGRYINRRPENALDLERVFEVALEQGVALEVNGLPDRLDLSGEHVRDALRAGVQIVCSTDAHSVRGLGNMALVGRDGAARLGDRRRRRQHPTPTVDPRRTSSGLAKGRGRLPGPPAVIATRRNGDAPLLEEGGSWEKAVCIGSSAWSPCWPRSCWPAADRSSRTSSRTASERSTRRCRRARSSRATRRRVVRRRTSFAPTPGSSPALSSTRPRSSTTPGRPREWRPRCNARSRRRRTGRSALDDLRASPNDRAKAAVARKQLARCGEEERRPGPGAVKKVFADRARRDRRDRGLRRHRRAGVQRAGGRPVRLPAALVRGRRGHRDRRLRGDVRPRGRHRGPARVRRRAHENGLRDRPGHPDRLAGGQPDDPRSGGRRRRADLSSCCSTSTTRCWSCCSSWDFC